MNRTLQQWLKPGKLADDTALLLTVVLAGAVFVADFLCPPALSLRVLYVFPLILLGIHVTRPPCLWLGHVLLLGGVGISISALPAPPLYRGIEFGASMLAYGTVFHLMRIGRALFLEIEDAATHDSLTGLNSRRVFQTALETEIARQQRTCLPFSLAVIDLDNFKQLNDSMGHDSGDRALQIAARAMKKNVRAADTLGRIGGDEFALLMPNTFGDGCTDTCRLLAARISLDMQRAGLAVTASVGGVTFIRPPGSALSAMKQADEEMYRVKRSQRRTARSEYAPPSFLA